MVDPTVPSGIRLRAAEIVLEHAVKAGEMDETADRLTKLERMAGLSVAAPKRSPDLTLLSATPLRAPAAPGREIAAPHVDNAETEKDVIE